MGFTNRISFTPFQYIKCCLYIIKKKVSLSRTIIQKVNKRFRNNSSSTKILHQVTEEKLSKAAKGKNHTSSFKARVCEQISRSSAVPPEIVLISDNMAVEGEQNELKCTATGLPKPTVVWKIGDQEYPNQEVSVFEPR